METAGEGELKIAGTPEALPLELIEAPGGFKVEELMLCAEFRELLHAANCIDTNKRMRLAEALQQKALAFATQLPLGDLERIEMNSSGHRMVLRYDAKRCLLVRTNTTVVQPPGDPNAADSAEDWLARHPEVAGVLAAAVLTTESRLQHRSFTTDFPADVMALVVREAARLPDLALKNVFPAWLVRIIYSRSQLYALRRQDGAVLIAFLLRTGWDRPEVETFYAEFAGVRAA